MSDKWTMSFTSWGRFSKKIALIKAYREIVPTIGLTKAKVDIENCVMYGEWPTNISVTREQAWNLQESFNLADPDAKITIKLRPCLKHNKMDKRKLEEFGNAALSNIISITQLVADEERNQDSNKEKIGKAKSLLQKVYFDLFDAINLVNQLDQSTDGEKQ